VDATDWLCEAKPILRNGMVLHSKAILTQWIGFAKQSQSIVMKKALRSKANHHDGLALPSKADRSQRIGFAKQSRSITMGWLCEAKPVRHKGLALRSKANPIA
jgi:hypothetical protein